MIPPEKAELKVMLFYEMFSVVSIFKTIWENEEEKQKTKNEKRIFFNDIQLIFYKKTQYFLINIVYLIIILFVQIKVSYIVIVLFALKVYICRL